MNGDPKMDCNSYLVFLALTINHKRNSGWGAHQKAPSLVITPDGQSHFLNQLIAENPLDILGKEAGDFPFLFKLLSAEKPLSIQVHPNKYQASEGYNRENIKDIPLDAPHRNYRDNNDKPELIVALTPFQAMCGFRPRHEVQEHLHLLKKGYVELPRYLTEVRTASEELRLIFVWMLSLTDDEKKHIIERIVHLAQQKEGNPVFDSILSLYQNYPEDGAIMAPLWLNLVNLQPGEAIFLEAGLPHAYLYGTGMEIMTSSDNVLRGGLTKKHIDLSELSEIVNFEPHNVPIMTPMMTKYHNLSLFPVPTIDFSFMELNVDRRWHRKANAVHIAFCKSGEVFFSGGGQSIVLTQGQSCLLPAACDVEINGKGMLSLAGSGDHLHTEAGFSPYQTEHLY